MTETPTALNHLTQKLDRPILLNDLTTIATQHQLTEISLFGSILRDDFRPDSDIDILIDFHPDATPTFTTLDRLQADLEALFDRRVDLVTRDGIAHSRNHLRRHEILSSSQPIYVSRSTVSA